MEPEEDLPFNQLEIT